MDVALFGGSCTRQTIATELSTLHGPLLTPCVRTSSTPDGGMLAAWHRLRYPWLSVGAIASGAPIDFYPDGKDSVQHLFLQAVLSAFQTYGGGGSKAAPCGDMVSQAFVPLLAQQATGDDPGRIINIASVDGLRIVDIEEYAYTASKAGVLHMSKQMAGHLAHRHIAVNCISPGLFPSKMLDKIFAVVPEEESMKEILKTTTGIYAGE